MAGGGGGGGGRAEGGTCNVNGFRALGFMALTIANSAGLGKMARAPKPETLNPKP